MSFPLHGLSVIAMLAVLAFIQGCATRPPTSSPVPQVRESAPPAAVALPEEAKEPTQTSAQMPPNIQPSIPPPVAPPESAVSAKPAAIDRSAPGLAPVERPQVQAKPKAVPKPAPVSKPVPKPEPPRVVVPDPQPVIAEPVAEEVLEEEVLEEAVHVNLEALPLNIGDEWTLSASGDFCTLSTPPVRFDDGQGMSRLQLVFTAQHWLVKTQSDIDMSYSGTGLSVDEGRYFPLEQLMRDTDLIFTKNYAAMTQAFMEARSLRITLGFWPSWPVTETKTITLSLQHFARAHRAWKMCQSLINAR